MSKEDIVCFYHANCTDGAASAAVIKKKYPHATFYPMNHGDPIPVSVKDKKVFIVDFSFKEEILKKFKEEAKEVFWYDHHKTSLPAHQSLQWGIIDLGESGASLTWKQEYPDQQVPKIIQYVKDKDIWEWKLPFSRAINMALREYEGIHDPESRIWQQLIGHLTDAEFEKMKEWGNRALKSQRMRMVEWSKNGFELEFEGCRAFAINWTLESSEMGEYIYKELGFEVAIIFSFVEDHWNFSLRSNQVDVSQIAVKYGGGGHPGASGFRHESIEWFLKLAKV